MRALLVTLGLHAHGPAATSVAWLGASGDEPCAIGDADATRALLMAARDHTASRGVPLGGWTQPPLVLAPGDALAKAIASTWPARES